MIVEQDADEDQDVDGCCHLHDYGDYHDHHHHGEQRDDGKGRADSGS